MSQRRCTARYTKESVMVNNPRAAAHTQHLLKPASRNNTESLGRGAGVTVAGGEWSWTKVARRITAVVARAKLVMKTEL
jgi:hypothetical protein